MCGFCSNICELENIKKGPFRGGYYPEKNEDQLVHDKDGFHLWSGVEDPFYAGVYFASIKYCPYCGGELKEVR